MKYNPGDVILIATEGIKKNHILKRPAFVLYSNDESIIACGVSRSRKFQGVTITKDDGATIQARINLHYMFTLTPDIVIKKLFSVKGSKRKEIYKKLKQKIQLLK